MQLEEAVLDSLVQKYGINVDATKPARLNRANLPTGTRIYEVRYSSLNTYLIDISSQRIACKSEDAPNKFLGVIDHYIETKRFRPKKDKEEGKKGKKGKEGKKGGFNLRPPRCQEFFVLSRDSRPG